MESWVIWGLLPGEKYLESFKLANKTAFTSVLVFGLWLRHRLFLIKLLPLVSTLLVVVLSWLYQLLVTRRHLNGTRSQSNQRMKKVNAMFKRMGESNVNFGRCGQWFCVAFVVNSAGRLKQLLSLLYLKLLRDCLPKILNQKSANTPGERRSAIICRMIY